MSLAVEGAASAPARQLGDGRRAGSVCMHMSAVEVDLACVADAQAAQDWNLSDGDAAEGVAVDAAWRVAKYAMKDARCLEAVARAHAGTVALDRWAWAASLAACCVGHVVDPDGAGDLPDVAAAVDAASSGGDPVCLSPLQGRRRRPHHPRHRRHRPCPRSPEVPCVRARRHTTRVLVHIAAPEVSAESRDKRTY